MDWTDEQAAAIAAAARGERGRLIAYAGTGKTTTLRGIAAARPQDALLYVAFNRVTAEAARATFPEHVTARTLHALAYAAQREWLREREVVGSWWRLRDRVTPLLPPEMRAPRWERSRWFGRTEAQAFAAVIDTLARFCFSADPCPGPAHVSRRTLDPIRAHVAQSFGRPLDPDELADVTALVQATVSDLAARCWDRLLADPTWPVPHDAYLKRWQLSQPVLPFDGVLLDEAQDASPVMLAVVLAQPSRIWMVGDPYQAIYGWRGAIDALSQFEAPAYPLSQSWRFGAAIAAGANRLLATCWQVDPPLTGLGPPGRWDGDRPAQDPAFAPPAEAMQEAVLCRSNVGVLRAALAALDQQRAVAIAGGAMPVADFIEAGVALFYGQAPRHPDLRDFGTWDELVLLSESAGGEAWRPIVQLVANGPEAAARAAQRLRQETVSEAAAGVIVSTAHKAKGREWPIVSLGADWAPFAGVDRLTRQRWRRDEEARLWYVAVTRARLWMRLGPAQEAWTASLRALSQPIPVA